MPAPSRPGAPLAVLASAALLTGLLSGCTAFAPPPDPEAVSTEVAVGVDARGDGTRLPDVTLPRFGGGRDQNLAELEGPAVVNFWASWCGPCQHELPYFERIHQQRDDVAVIGINFLDPRPEAAAELIAETGVTFASYADPDGEIAGQGALPLQLLRGLPYTAYVAADGEVVYGEFRAYDSLEEIEERIAEHLDLDPTGAATETAAKSGDDG